MIQRLSSLTLRSLRRKKARGRGWIYENISFTGYGINSIFERRYRAEIGNADAENNGNAQDNTDGGQSVAGFFTPQAPQG